MAEKSTKFYISTSLDENDDFLDENLVLEESPNGRWNKLATETTIQNLIDFDKIHLAIDTEKGFELAWNEIHIDYIKTKLTNEQQIKKFNNNIDTILNYLIKLDHLNILTFYDYWYDKRESKWVVITELSTAGSLKKLLDQAKQSKTPIKQKTYKRWLNQILNATTYIHLQHVSIFQGKLNTDKIFIQNNSAIKIAPSLLSLCMNDSDSPSSFLKCPPSSTEQQQQPVQQQQQYKRCINDILNFDDNIVDKDLYSIGLIAIEIFTAHLSLNTVVQSLNLTSSSSSPTIPINNSTNTNIQLIAKLIVKENNYEKFKNLFDLDQFNFIYDCLKSSSIIDYHQELSSSSSPVTPLSPTSASIALLNNKKIEKKLKIEYLLYQPLVNEIYSLKVLSIYSLLVFYQDKHFNKIILGSRHAKKSLTDDDNNNLLFSNFLSNINSNNNTNNSRNNSNGDVLFTNNEHKVFIRKVSLNSLANTTNNLPKDFFSILEDIKLGCYPRLYSYYINHRNLNTSFNILKNIPSNNSFNKAFQQYNNACRRPSSLYISSNNSSSNNSTTNLADFCNKPIREEINNKDVDKNKNKNNVIIDKIDNQNIDLNLPVGDHRHHINESENEKNLKFNAETRRIKSENCTLSKCSKETDMHQLVIKLKFDDNLCRTLECTLSSIDLCINDANKLNLNDIVNNNEIQTKLFQLCLKLANELIDFGLINDKDKDILTNILVKTLVSSY